MRDIGLPKVLSWRWAPFVALVAGACSFAAFAALVIPERIGAASASPTTASFSFNSLTGSTGSERASTFSSTEPTSGTATFSSLPSQPTISRTGSGLFPKRGFTPPLERAEPPPAPPPAVVVPPQPALDPAQVQPQAQQVPPPPMDQAAPPPPAPPEPVAMPTPEEPRRE